MSNNYKTDERNKLYINLERDIKDCKEAILGVNCQNKTGHAVYIYKNNKNIDVSVSSVIYRD